MALDPNLDLLATALAVASLVSLLVIVAAGWAVGRAGRVSAARRDAARGLPADAWPAISVLKPLKGADPDLLDNLRAVARQDYPCFELVLGTADPDDPALGIARTLAREMATERPELAITIATGAPDLGLNPKVSNLAHLARSARHPWLLISDADVRPGPGYLTALAAETLAPAAPRLVSSLLAGGGEQSVGAAMENLHFAGFVARGVAAAEVFASAPCVVGKSMLFARDAFERAGGFPAVADVLAEDYVLGDRFRRAGFAVALSGLPLRVVARDKSLRAFLARHLRWAQMRCRLSAAGYLGELLLNPVVFAAGLALVALAGAPPPGMGTADALALAAAVAAGKVAADARLLRTLRGEPAKLRHLMLVPLKDLAIAALWPLAVAKRTIDWRGTVLEIGAGSALRRLPEAAEPDAAPRPVEVL
jgi:ceramide glucosyltransferase